MKIHADWYEDEIEDGRALWRMDLPDVQIQVSLDVLNLEDVDDGEEPKYGKNAAMFIEHDVRGGGPTGEDRTKYSGEDFTASREEVWALLAMSRGDVEKRLATEIRSVKAMPSDPNYCKPQPVPADDDVARGQREWRKKFAAYEFNKQAIATRARLADAAGELLKACEGVLECTDRNGGVFIPANGDTITKLRAAVAKAKGK